MPLELLGRQYILERLETFSVYIPTHKTYFQVGRTLWLSWVVRLKRNSDILSSILDGGEFEKPLLDPCTRIGAWASFMDSDCVAIDFLWEIFFLGDWLRKETDGSEPCFQMRSREIPRLHRGVTRDPSSRSAP